MRITLSRFAVAIAGYACTLAPLHAATVDVHFLPRQQYTDAGVNEVPASDPIGEIRRYLVQLGQTLPVTETLTVDILDIDLAGTSRPVAGQPHDLRLMKGSADAPRIVLRYALTDQGRVIKDGKADLVDLAYLERPLRVNSPEPYPYEKRLLADWFKSAFGASASGQARLHH